MVDMLINIGRALNGPGWCCHLSHFGVSFGLISNLETAAIYTCAHPLNVNYRIDHIGEYFMNFRRNVNFNENMN